jgi:UDP-N-acetylmuramyl pentapeptide phosphotransferase/UDP-N-acetylglucosamine-1-phosphate transferase
MKVQASELYRLTALGQSLFYIATGVWSLVGIKSFQKVTGPKTDVWLVKTVGALVIVIGSVLGMAGARRTESSEIAVLGAGSAAALAAIDVVYVSRKRISPIYLLDAVAEGSLIAMWAAGWQLKSNRRALDSKK